MTVLEWVLKNAHIGENYVVHMVGLIYPAEHEGTTTTVKENRGEIL